MDQSYLDKQISRYLILMTFQIRPYHPSDLVALYRICLQTGNNGKDASQLYKDPDLLGHLYAAPYAVSEPDLCFLLTHEDERCGYILGTRDTRMFNQWCELNWFPHLRERYGIPKTDDTSHDVRLIHLIHHKQSSRDD
jgi:hypothetical protein